MSTIICLPFKMSWIFVHLRFLDTEDYRLKSGTPACHAPQPAARKNLEKGLFQSTDNQQTETQASTWIRESF